MDFLTNSEFSVQIIQAMRCAQVNERIFFHGIRRSIYSVHGSSLEGTSTAKSRQQILQSKLQKTATRVSLETTKFIRVAYTHFFS
jgi:hypothetical protein